LRAGYRADDKIQRKSRAPQNLITTKNIRSFEGGGRGGAEKRASKKCGATHWVEASDPMSRAGQQNGSGRLYFDAQFPRRHGDEFNRQREGSAPDDAFGDGIEPGQTDDAGADGGDERGHFLRRPAAGGEIPFHGASFISIPSSDENQSFILSPWRESLTRVFSATEALPNGEIDHAERRTTRQSDANLNFF
jgi:hypothetical protein